MDIYPGLKIRNRRNTGRAMNRYAGQCSFPISVGHLRRVRQDLATVSEIFSQEQVWPDQCEYILHLFDGIKQTTDSFVEFVNSKSARTGPFGAHRYPILAQTCYFSSQVEKARNLTREFARISVRSSAKKSRHKQINNSLNQVRLSFNNLIKGIDRLLEES